MRTKNIWLMAFLIIFGLLISGCGLIGQEPEPSSTPTPVSDPGVVAEANLMPADHINLHFAMAGEVRDILVEEGDFINAGQAMARLANVEAREAQILAAEQAVLQAEQHLEELQEKAALTAARAEVNLVEARQRLVEAEQAWEAVDTDVFSEDLDDAKVDLIETRDELEEAQETLADHSDLDETNIVRQGYEDDVDEAQQDYDEARWALEGLQNQYDLAKGMLAQTEAALADAEREVEATQGGRPNPDDLAMAEGNLDQARGQLRAAERALGDVELRAPFDGKVVRVELTEGATTTPSQLAFVLADMSAWVLETSDLTEHEVVDLGLGDEVKITFDALPDQTFTGEVESISDYFLERFGDITYKVRIRLNEGDDRLRWGMTAEVSFPE
jgi:HlyD family secretion protein